MVTPNSFVMKFNERIVTPGTYTGICLSQHLPAILIQPYGIRRKAAGIDPKGIEKRDVNFVN